MAKKRGHGGAGLVTLALAAIGVISVISNNSSKKASAAYPLLVKSEAAYSRPYELEDAYPSSELFQQANNLDDKGESEIYSVPDTQVDSIEDSSDAVLLTGKAAEYEQLLRDSPELRAAIELISSVESNGRFNLIYGGIYLDDFSSHPYYVNCAGGYCSDAAGIGQFLSGTWNSVSSALGLTSFTPKEQLVGMVYLLDHKRGVLDEILEGDIAAALPNMSCEWAGLPPDYCGYGQLDNYLWRRAVEDYKAEVTSRLTEQGITSDSAPDTFQSKVQTEIDNWANSLKQEDIDSIISREMNEYLMEKVSLYNNTFLPAARAGEDIVSQTLSD